MGVVWQSWCVTPAKSSIWNKLLHTRNHSFAKHDGVFSVPLEIFNRECGCHAKGFSASSIHRAGAHCSFLAATVRQ
jgi:hypothetical protein